MRTTPSVPTDPSVTLTAWPTADAYERDDYKNPEWTERLFDASDSAGMARDF